MGQVPESKKILTIGNGRVAKHWLHYLKLLNIPSSHWFRASNTAPIKADYDLVFLAVSDSAIPALLMAHPWLQKTKVVHFSGANYFDGILGLHPLMTFSQELYDLDTYRNMTLAYDFSATEYHQHFAFLPNPNWFIAPELKAKYHALCVMSGNFPQILWQHLEQEISKLGCPVDGWKNYLLRSTQNFVNDSNSLTGPLARNDLATIQKNIDSLTGSPLQDMYKTFCQFYGLRGEL